ncbi:MAG: hypothetical protein NC094_12240 [Bacteroidales bacterium]|nr:hypothetical protein [Lachnoclostridium sp.]MCM1385383.1 hypothetical protein [Lachnoclostridium sp.]MCM1466179.1 hypothetical protein [Bacteroidales bacterium]
MDTRKAAILLVGFLCLFLSGCRMDEEPGENSSEAEYQAKMPAEGVSAAELPVFLADSKEATETSGANLPGGFAISNYYCTNRKTPTNQYIIDENQVLWGYGYNDFGQLGNGKTDANGTVYTEPVKMAENVVSVDASGNGFFTIYLTEDGKLYGVGSNRSGLLGQPYETCYFDDNYHKVTKPVLLMQDVAYASAGMESILALKQDGTVWWWGEYRTTYSTKAYEYASEYYWQSEEDEKNPVKMLYNAPKMILEDCVYAVTGDWHGAAITSNGELYTWGLNIYGDCGVEMGEDDYVRSPTKVLDGVRMVWTERIDARGTGQGIYDTSTLTAKYDFNVFAQLKDGTMLAAGRDLGSLEKTIAFTGDMETLGTATYSDIFVPIAVYSEEDFRGRVG